MITITSTLYRGLLLVVLLFFSQAVLACCPSGGNGTPATTGLGESAPPTADLASDPSWSVYRFTKKGIDYTQINDSNGYVRAAAGNISDTVWALPVGVDSDRVLTTGDTIPAGRQTLVYQAPDITVVMINAADGIYWLITAPADR